jgi:hypothetical protein
VRHTHRALATTAALVLLLSACGGQDPTIDVEPGAESDGALDGTVEGTDGEQASDGGGTVDEDEAVAAATADLAATEGVDEGEIEVVTYERVTWSDGSLGCPDPDGMYTQALVPGYRIVLALGGAEVHYHGAEDGPPSRCDDPSPPAASDG